MGRVNRSCWMAFTMLMLISAQAVARPAVMQGLQPVGEGRLSWWGITLYRASLHAPSGEYDPDRRHLLQIEYARSFSREQLATSSLQEIEKLRGQQPDRDRLLGQLTRVLADVESGDRISGVHLPGEGALFYKGERLIGRLDDAELARDFFAIWLSPQTTEPALRSQLLGGRG